MFKFLKDLFKVPTPKPKIETPAFNTLTIPEDFEIKYEFNDIKVAGVEYANPIRSELKKGEEVNLIFERKNKHDKKAIKVMQNNIKLGYIPRNSALQGLIHKFYENDCLVVAVLKKINPKNILIDVKLYDSIKNKYVSTEFELTKIKKSYKEHWDYVKYNEILDIEFDLDSEKYTIENKLGEPLGTIPPTLIKSDDDNFDEDEEYIEPNELDKYKDIFCYASYINYEYDDYDDKIVTSAELVIICIE